MNRAPIARPREAVRVLLWALASTSVLAAAASTLPPPLIAGLDHIPLAVRNLDQAAADYRKLGFTLKPGRMHANGIRNQHVKFQDGTEIELITADDARDSMTAEYLKQLRLGDGPAFLGFYAPEMAALSQRLKALAQPHSLDDGLISLSDPLHYIFFAGRNRSPTDLPEYLVHANGAEALIGVWIATDDSEPERHLLESLGATVAEREAHAPGPVTATVATLKQGEVIFLPASRQVVTGRRIVGAVLRARDLKKLRGLFGGPRQNGLQSAHTANSRSLFVPPADAHGIWLEFRESVP